MDSLRAGDYAEQPPHDPSKPKPPYRSGLQLQIRRHIPPPPFGLGYLQPYRRKEKEFSEFSSMTPSEFCFQNPPPSTDPHPDSSVHTLKIVKEVATRDGRGSQVVCCRLDQQPDYVIAKIFDPLYYSWGEYDNAYWADRHYSCEAAGYEHAVLEGKDGQWLPKYHGSWTFEMDLDLANQPDKKREVRMILLEYIPGSSMYSILTSDQTDQFSPDTRMDILSRAMEMYCWLKYYGVSQNDFAPRNIMIGTDNRVTLIDLSHAYVTGLPNSGTVFREQTRPDSPAERFHVMSGEFDCWIPEKYLSGTAFDRWRETRWEGSEEFEPCPEWAKYSKNSRSKSSSPRSGRSK